jgi:hypothetical protein
MPVLPEQDTHQRISAILRNSGSGPACASSIPKLLAGLFPTTAEARRARSGDAYFAVPQAFGHFEKQEVWFASQAFLSLSVLADFWHN